MSEFKPNHGSSLKDALNRIEEKLDDINARVYEVDSELRAHIGFHKGRESQ